LAFDELSNVLLIDGIVEPVSGMTRLQNRSMGLVISISSRN
jgi:hypothetical protein